MCTALKGAYCTPDQFCNCLCIFLKTYKTLVTSWRYIPNRLHPKEPNYYTEISLTPLVIDLWLKTWKILIFAHFLLYLHNKDLYWSKTVIFEIIGTFLTRCIGYFVQSCFIIWENAQSSKINNNGLYWSKTAIFEILGTFLTRCTCIGYLSNIALLFEKMHRLQK